MLIGISRVADIDRARAILLELAGKNSLATQVCGCPLTELRSSGIVLSLDAWCADALTAITFKSELLEQAVKRFALADIRVSFLPTTVILRDDRQANNPLGEQNEGLHTQVVNNHGHSRVIPHGEVAAAASA